MSIQFKCPGCGAEGVADGATGREKVTCKSCGKTMRLPSRTPIPDGAIQFRCVGCGKSMTAPPQLAGKKVTCKACGQTGVKVPGTPAASPAPTRPVSDKPGPKATPAPAPGPASLDLYGLEEPAPATTAKPAGDDLFADSKSGPVTASAPSEEALPPRNKLFEPMSAEKKKKVNKRADKINKEKPSFAGTAVGGVSFGTILAITLFGWRLYRIGHKVTRGLDPEVNAAAEFEPAGLQPRVNLDPKALAAEGDRDVERMLKEPGAAEAREWLDPAKHPNHAVFEMGNDRARAMIAGFYDRGAKRVSVLEADALGDAVVTAEIAVELPDEPDKRAQCLAWEVQYLEGEDPTKDLGQKYLLITTD